MLEFEIKLDGADRLIDKLKRIGINSPEKVLHRSFLDAALLVEGKLKSNISGSMLKVRSGRLRSSIGSMVTSSGDSIKATIGSGVRSGERVEYANIHETGGTITPKKGRYLTIPIGDARTPAGVTRFSARALMTGQTNYTGSFIRKHLIYGTSGTGKNRRITPLFALKPSVTIPASHYLSKTLSGSIKDIMGIISKRIKEAVNKQ